ncbi:hypothetical protein D3P09_24795 [Paenibacillus pinisoli]|uniref:Uncharacterized protein n=1 Tax=Paenibacillus pinisoli TaxID=1276110 RepID=A0A3A6PBD2_9BACL|nr:hypothetical protein [Paenibacillus pinisoli]RJX37130.1 hypothetical protein D3P09_24795 [Paenibacillus pinisoli]
MNNGSNPEWYDALKLDQPLRSRTFTDKMAADIHNRALGKPARQAMSWRKRRTLGAVLIAAALCFIVFFTNMPEQSLVTDPPSHAGATGPELDREIRDLLINYRSKTGWKKQVLLQKPLPDNQVIIYSVMPKESGLKDNIYIDILQWKDYGGSKAIGTGVDGWSHMFSVDGPYTYMTVMDGVTMDAVTTVGNMHLFHGKLAYDIDGIRLSDSSGNYWDAETVQSQFSGNYWFAITPATSKLEEYTVAALDKKGKVMGTNKYLLPIAE